MAPHNDSKYYEFRLTQQPTSQSEVKPPEGEKWVLLQMVPNGASVLFLWSRQKK